MPCLSLYFVLMSLWTCCQLRKLWKHFIRKNVLDIVKTKYVFWYLSVCNGCGFIQKVILNSLLKMTKLLKCAIEHFHIKVSVVVSAQGSCLCVEHHLWVWSGGKEETQVSGSRLAQPVSPSHVSRRRDVICQSSFHSTAIQKTERTTRILSWWFPSSSTCSVLRARVELRKHNKSIVWPSPRSLGLSWVLYFNTISLMEIRG